MAMVTKRQKLVNYLAANYPRIISGSVRPGYKLIDPTYTTCKTSGKLCIPLQVELLALNSQATRATRWYKIRNMSPTLWSHY